MEVSLECSGICEAKDMYMFSDINRGFPKNKDPCFEVLMKKINDWDDILFIFLLGCSLGKNKLR